MSVETASKEEYTFFGPHEQHPRGHGFTGDMPSWSLPRQVDMLKEELRAKEDALATPEIAKNRPELAYQVRELKQRIHDIESSKPKLSPKKKDELAKARGELLSAIQESGYTRSEMRSGRADAHTLLERSESYKIPISKELADACGVRMEKGKATRDGATRAFKIISKALGEESSSHLLYKPER